MWLGTGNLLNQVQLAVPGFHLALTVGESAVSKFALGLKQIAAGKVGGGWRPWRRPCLSSSR
jgi:hypothetical protein